MESASPAASHPRNHPETSRMVPSSRPKVALVFPPFGPQFIPSLGLAVLSAGVKKLGFECRTFYWNLDVNSALPQNKPVERMRFYESLTKQGMFPLNEWIFAKQVFPQSADDDPRISRRLAKLDARLQQSRRHSLFRFHRQQSPPSRTILALRERAHDLVAAMVDRLGPYDVIGITSTFFQNIPALALAKKLKETWPEKIVVLGGANCDDVMGATLLAQFDFLDYVFSGEVDFSFPEFVERLANGAPPSEVSGIVFRDARGGIARGPAAMPREDMNCLPIPDYDDFVAEREASDLALTSIPLSLALESSRGCWWGAKQHCVFCGLNANGMAFRQKTYERFQTEVEQVVDRYGPRFLFMTDNILSTGYYKEFVGWAEQRGLGVDFFYEIKANLNRKQVQEMSQAGISFVQPGVESFSTSTLSLMKKGIRAIQNVAFLKYARDNGVQTLYGILGGFPGEDPDEYHKMAADLRKLVHLEPPGGVAEVQYHRFSPMFHDPPSALRPIPDYSELYPFPEDVIAGLAYYFEPAGAQDYPYLGPVIEAVNRWKDVWNSQACTLTWASAGGDILIRDRRPGYADRDFRLADHAVAVFHALDRPRKLQAVIRDLSSEEAQLPIVDPADSSRAQADGSSTDASVHGLFGRMPRRHQSRRQMDGCAGEDLVSFTREEFAHRPEECLRPLVKAELLYVEDDLYLTLPVAAGNRAYQSEWHYREPNWFQNILSRLHLRSRLPRRASTAALPV